MTLFVLLGVLSPRRRLYEPETAGLIRKKIAHFELDSHCVRFGFMDGHELTHLLISFLYA